MKTKQTKMLLTEMLREEMLEINFKEYKNFHKDFAHPQKRYRYEAVRVSGSERFAIVLASVTRIKLIKGKLAMPTEELAYLRKSQTIYDAFFGNASGFFTVAFEMLDTLKDNNEALDNAFTDIENGIAGGEGDKITAMNDLRVTLILALAYVNKLALLNQRQAVAIITAAHMEVIGRTKFDKQAISVKIGDAPGEIIMTSIRPKEGKFFLVTTYFGAYSYDSGVTWVDLEDPSHTSKVIVKGLTSNKSVILRSRTWTKNGWSVWSVSQPITPE